MTALNDFLISATFIIFSIFITPTSANSFRRQDDARISMREEAEASLMKELSGTFRPGATKDHVIKLEQQLKPMFTAVPQQGDGTLTHSVVRYTLHRFFVQRGWYIRGLEPAASTIVGDRVGSSIGNHTLQGIHEWVPSFLQGFLEQLHGGRGISVRELAVLAATLEDLVHKESNYFMQKTLYILSVGFKKQFDEKEIAEVLEVYMMNYLLGRQTNRKGFMHLSWERTEFKKGQGAQWPKITAWMQNVRRQVAPKGPVDVKTLTRIIEQIGEQYHDFKEEECSHLKSELLDIESKKAGRVRLTEFYKKGMDKHAFAKYNEQFDYLKALGAIDESDPMNPHVIVPNYVASRPNCLAASGFYVICCKNECEDLMGKLESEVKDEFASPAQLLKMVASYSSDTVEGPRTLSQTLVQKLYGIAKVNHGVVPIHGRLFAQWMHHAFPRECPFPHEMGQTNPQTPDAWMQETGREAATLSQDDIEKHLDVHGEANDLHPTGSAARKHHHFEENELPWTHAEELLIPLDPTLTAKSQLNHTLRTMVVFVTLVAMGLIVKSLIFQVSGCDADSKLV